MNKPLAIILDLDDTIIDDSTSVEPSWRRVCAEAALRTDGLQPETLYAAVASIRKVFWGDPEQNRIGRLDLLVANNHIAYGALSSLGYYLPGCARFMSERYSAIRAGAAELFPESIDTLAQLAALNVRLGLITNGDGAFQRAKLDRLNLEPYFYHILIEGEFGAGKPDQRVYLAALKALNATPDQTWMIGDDLEEDIQAAQNLGIRGVWLDRTKAGLPTETAVRPDAVIHSLAELLAITDMSM